jgi:hypothetical protein
LSMTRTLRILSALAVLHRSPHCTCFYHLGHWHLERRLSYPRLSLICDPCPTHPICAHLCGPWLRGCRFPWQMGLGFKVFGRNPIEPRTDRTGSNTSERPSTPRQAQLILHLLPPSPSWPSVDSKTRHRPDYHHRRNVTRLFFFPFRPIASSSLPSFPFYQFALFLFRQRH